MPKAVRAEADDAPERWLHATRMIDKDHRAVIATARRLTDGFTDDRGKALALFSFVRDEVKFGFARGFWDIRASDVLRSRMGYCNTKSTLFLALLRASGIPACQVFVDIDAQVLHGIIDPGTPYVDHSYVEVFLSGKWIATDAYIVDPPLFRAAHTRAAAEGRQLGYGVHVTGTTEWDGTGPAFSQFNMLDPRPIGTTAWGVYEDVAEFYARAERPWNRLNPILRGGFGFAANGANARAEALRQS